MNPELARNLWLEVNPHRLVLMPAVILGVAFLARDWLSPLALLGFVLLSVIWGARQAANAVIEEARQRTWDIQRMSSMDPWAMTWGKLVGATSIAWYGGLICLVLYLGSGPVEVPAQKLIVGAIVVCAAVAVQSAAMIAALAGMRLERRINSRLSNVAMILLVILLVPGLFDSLTDPGPVRWYATAYPGPSFTLCSAAIFAVWGIVGAYRAMCAELQVRALPWLWIGFALFAAVYATGFTVDGPLPATRLSARIASMGVVCAMTMSYVGGFAAPRDPVDYRRALRAAAGGEWRRAAEELPLWLASASFAFVLGAASFVLGSDPHLVNDRPDNLGPAALALGFMMLRDLALLTYLSFRSRTRRAAAAAIVYIAALDVLLPALLDLSGLGVLGSFVMPAVLETPRFATLVFAAHAALACTFAVRAYRTAVPAVS